MLHCNFCVPHGLAAATAASCAMALAQESKPNDLGHSMLSVATHRTESLSHVGVAAQDISGPALYIWKCLVLLRYCHRTMVALDIVSARLHFCREPGASTNSFTMLPSMPQGTPTTAVFTWH